MTARHVFWRDATGNASKDEKWAPAQVLAEIGKAAKINDEGGVQWESLFVLQRYDTTVRSKVVILGANGEELNGHDAWGIVRRAMIDVIKKDGGGTPIGLGRFISKGNELARKFFAQPTSDFHLVSSVSVKSFPFKWAAVDRCRIWPLPNRKRYALPAVTRYVDSSSPIGQHLSRTRYRLLRVSVSGRTIYEASETALAAINHLRALWNLFARIGSWSIRGGSSKASPLSVVHGGPVHTLHHPDGSPVDDVYWYEPSFVGDQKLFDASTKKWAYMERSRKWATKRIKAVSYGDDVKHLLDRYVQALDSPNLDVAFLHMWGLLEKMTGTVGARYDDTVKRSVRLMTDRDTSVEMIEAVRSRRNQYVHSARSADDSDQIAYMVKSFVDPHLIWLLRNDFGVTSVEEYGEILGLSADSSALAGRCDRLMRDLRWTKKMIEVDKK